MLVSLVLTAQQYRGTGRLKGLITDEQGASVADVTVKLFHTKLGAGFEVKTDDKGEWKAYFIRVGQWNIDMEKEGYEVYKSSANVPSNGQLIEVNIVMKKKETGQAGESGFSKEIMKKLEEGNALFKNGQFDQALPVYQAILTENPDAYLINFSIANCYFGKKDYQQAISFYQKVLDKDSSHTQSLLSIGNSYNNMNQEEKAMEFYKKIDHNLITDPIVLYNIGIFYFNSADNNQAITYFKKAVDIKPDFLDALYQLGLTYMGNAMNKEAAQTFENYLAKDPASERSQQIKEIMQALKES
jgi:tetratricopeptide (TPR) repeat protein